MELGELVFEGTDLVPVGFTLLRDFDGYCINKAGDVYDIYEAKMVQPELDQEGYMKYLLPRTSRYPIVGRYRLIAETYIPVPANLLRSGQRLVVNHINSVKTDDRPVNLEWTTFKGNLEHAGDSGLHPKCYPIRVYTIATGTEEYFPSATEYGRRNKMSKDAILWRMRTDGQRVFEGRLYKHGHSKTPWTTETAEHQAVFGMTRKIDVKFVLTGEERTFASAKEATKAIGCKPAALSAWLRLPHHPVLPGYVQVKFHNPTVAFRVVKDPVEELAKHTKDKPIVVIDVARGKAKVYDSLGSAAKALSMLPQTLHYRLNNNKGAVWDGLKFMYHSEFVGSATVATL